MKKILFVVLFVFLLAGCGSSEAPVNVWDSISLDFMEMTIDKIEIRDELTVKHTTGNANSSSSVSIGLSSANGVTYVMMRGKITNKSNSVLPAKNIKSNISVDGKETNGHIFLAYDDATYADDLGAGKTATYAIYIPIDEAVANSYSKVVVKFGFNDNFASASSVSSCKYKYSLTANR